MPTGHQEGSHTRRALPLAGRIGSAARVLVCWALVCAWPAAAVRAQLTWTRKTVELNPDGQSSVVEARFPFSNDGASAVDIRQVQTSCGCTTVALAQRHYEPGQAGEIVARYTVGEQVGLQEKTILVSTDGAPAATLLTLLVHLPDLVHIRPAFVAWKAAESTLTKVITVESADAATWPLEGVTVSSSSNDVITDSAPVVAGSKYEISVTPKSTGKPLFATLLIRCRIGGQQRVFHALASVQAIPATRFSPPATGPASPPAQPLPQTSETK